MKRFLHPVLALACLVWCLIPTALGAGLTSPQAVGPFLNGVFPETTPGPTGSWDVEDAFPNLEFVDPVRMVKDPLGPENVYVVCRNGEIWRVPFSKDAVEADKVRFLDERVYTWGYWDAGMLGFAFHPKFGVPGDPDRGTVFAFYQYLPLSPAQPWNSWYSGSYMVLSRFTVPDGEEAVDMMTEEVLILQYDRHNWHNGGQMFFGPDGFLYLVVGDEGDANDSYGVCQKIDDRLFSGILRIDVDQDPSRSHPIRRQPANAGITPPGWEQSYTQGYSIPNDNPWLDENGGVLEEFWTIGLRSPHSMHFDAATGDIWIAEVGQETREEITLAVKGGNHQWPYKEGSVDGIVPKPAEIIGVEVPPVFDYGRSMGGCVIGGIVYRGTEHSAVLEGKYLFGDHNTAAIYALTRNPGGPATVEYLTSVPRSGGLQTGLSGICEGPDGEAYLMELGTMATETGKIYKLVRNGTPVPDPPQLLSQTGAFTDLATLTPSPGLIPYGVNSPLWTDNAAKRRWVAIPNDGTHDTPEEQVVFHPEGEWEFPIGTVLVKHFALPVDESDPSVLRPVETRFFVHGSDGKYYGVTYRWNEEGTDATLLTTGEDVDIGIELAGGGTREQTWTIPGRADCRTCHTANAGEVLGLRSHQLNGDFLYPSTGIAANQLETWAALGIFGDSFGGHAAGSLPRSVAVSDPHASLDHRVRSYLDANCSHCHRPGGVSANFDARFSVPLAVQNIVGGAINRPIGDPDVKVVDPGDLAKSLLHTRVSAVGSMQMPPLGKNVVDEEAVEVLADWIRSMDPASFGFEGVDQPPVAGNDGLSAGHGRETLLDVLPNDSDANAPPGIHGLAILSPPAHGSLRILGAQKRLSYVHDGSDSWSDTFTYTLTDPQGLVSEPATVSIGIPLDFAAWSAVTPGAGGSAGSNADGDAHDDLLEFALGGSPQSGAPPAAGGASLNLDGGFELVVRRPEGLSGLSYFAETSVDLDTWETMAAGGIESGDGIETLRFAGLDTRPGIGADAGFVRLRVVAEGEGESATLPLGWLAADYGPGFHAYGNPFREPPVFGSAVVGMEPGLLVVNGDPGLPADFSGYIEVVAGPHAGHRFEVDAAAGGIGRIAVAASPGNTLAALPDLTGSRIVVCAHHRLGAIVPEAVLVGSANPAAADRIHLHRNDGVGPPAYRLHYLLDGGPGHGIRGWRSFLPGGGDEGGLVLPPGEGALFHRPAGAAPVRLTFSGEVRANRFVRPLVPGRNLVSSPFPLPVSPRQFGLLEGGFAVGDRFRLHEAGAFRNFLLEDGGEGPDRWREDLPDAPDAGDLPLFEPGASFFVIPAAGHGGHAVEPVWEP